MPQPSQVFLLWSVFTQVVAVTSGDNEVISQEEAVNYMKQWRPKEDGVSETFLRENADFAIKTRDLPYANQVPKSMFMTYVLPYAHFDEPRDNWRPLMHRKLVELVKGKQTLQSAAEALFPAWGNAFGKQLQFKGDQTPKQMAPLTETLERGYASCTGMSIFLADCMRSVGIPARIVGISEWNRPEGGNHNWVEIWVGDHWNFVDAVPTKDPVTWNQTWFTDQAKKQMSQPPRYAIMTPFWGQASTLYNMSWRTPATFVPAIDITAEYGGLGSQTSGFAWSFLGPLLIGIVVVGCIGYIFKVRKDRAGYEEIK